MSHKHRKYVWFVVSEGLCNSKSRSVFPIPVTEATCIPERKTPRLPNNQSADGRMNAGVRSQESPEVWRHTVGCTTACLDIGLPYFSQSLQVPSGLHLGHWYLQIYHDRLLPNPYATPDRRLILFCVIRRM
jgi:hypothetical protein